MPPPSLAELCRRWRESLFTELPWDKDPISAMQPGEAGGYLARAPGFPHRAYLKPLTMCDEHTPRAANEKIVADLAHDLGFNVPPVLLYGRINNVLLGEEKRCCVSLVLYPEQYEWGMIFDLSIFPPPVQHILRESMSQYSRTFALDLLIGQTDRNNNRNAIIGIGEGQPRRTELIFLDHSSSLNYGNRWAGSGWNNVEMVPIPTVFRESLSKPLVLEGAQQIATLSNEKIREIVDRIPLDYMSHSHRQTVMEGLIGRKGMIVDFVDHTL